VKAGHAKTNPYQFNPNLLKRLSIKILQPLNIVKDDAHKT